MAVVAAAAAASALFTRFCSHPPLHTHRYRKVLEATMDGFNSGSAEAVHMRKVLPGCGRPAILGKCAWWLIFTPFWSHLPFTGGPRGAALRIRAVRVGGASARGAAALRAVPPHP